MRMSINLLQKTSSLLVISLKYFSEVLYYFTIVDEPISYVVIASDRHILKKWKLAHIYYRSWSITCMQNVTNIAKWTIRYGEKQKRCSLEILWGVTRNVRSLIEFKVRSLRVQSNSVLFDYQSDFEFLYR